MPTTTSWSGKRRSFPTATREHIMRRDNHRCQIQGPTCTQVATEADHIINHARGGTDEPSNGQAVCKPCHDMKTKNERSIGRQRVSRKRPPTQHPGLT